jgi:hypothetical protein
LFVMRRGNKVNLLCLFFVYRQLTFKMEFFFSSLSHPLTSRGTTFRSPRPRPRFHSSRPTDWRGVGLSNLLYRLRSLVPHLFNQFFAYEESS